MSKEISNYAKKKQKSKKDTVFVIVIGLVLVNLTIYLTNSIMKLSLNYASINSWALCIADLIAIIGVLWLLRNYNIRRKQAVKDDKERMNNADKKL